MMKNDTKTHYLEQILPRYQKANRLEKKQILDEFCQVCAYHRKHALRLLNKKPVPKRKRATKKKIETRGRKSLYNHESILKPLQAIWRTSGYMCSKKLVVVIPDWINAYQIHFGTLNPEVLSALQSISSSSLDRLLKYTRVQNKPKGLSGTRPGTLLKNQIPIKVDHWDVTKAGFLEADTVAHCGQSLAGDFIWSVTLTDIFTTWTECRATWNKGSEGVCEKIHHVEQSLPFAILGFDCDNGSEFLNHHLWRYFTERPEPVQFTRSRPYHSNDNAHVEQKNWTHVRQLFGYARLAQEKFVDPMNVIYADWSLYQNHFIPTMKLIEKKRVNSRYQKRYDKPQTPYQRVLLCAEVSDAEKERLKALHQTLDPFVLRERILKNSQRISKELF
jgi:hypothetical protein